MTEHTEANSTHTMTEAPVRKKRGLGGVVAVLVALLAAAGVAGYWGYGQWQAQQQALQALQTQLGELEQRLQAQLEQRAKQSTLQGLLDESRQVQNALQQGLQAAQARLDAQEKQLQSVRQQVAQDADQWHVSDIERLLHAAELRINTLDDPIGARQALREADRLASLLGGEAQALRTALAHILNQFDRHPPLDRDVLAGKLLQMAQNLPELPQTRGEKDASAPADAAGADWWQRSKQWFSGWFSIKNTASATNTPAPATAAPPLQQAAEQLLQARSALLARQYDEAQRLSAQALSQVQQVATLDSASPKVAATLAALRDAVSDLERAQTAQSIDFAPLYAQLRALRTPPAAPSVPANPVQEP